MYIIYCFLFVIHFNKSFGIVAHVIMLFVSSLFLITLFFNVSCNIFSHLSIGTLRSQCEELHTHLTPALNIGPINERRPRELPSPSLAVVL